MWISDIVLPMKFLPLLGGLILPHSSLDVHTPELSADSQYNVLNYLGGAGPYFQYPGHGISPLTPDTCEVTQIYLISRHGERFPTKGSGATYNSTINHLKSQELNGSLAFIKDYEYFVTDSDDLAMEVTLENSNSKFAGSLSALRNGINVRQRYGHLYNESQVLPVFTSNSIRVHDTSLNFLRGFLADQYDESKFKLNIISEDASMGANSLTPKEGCDAFVNASDASDDLEYPLKDYFDGIRSRLQQDNPDLNISDLQIDNLFDICAYEINVKEYSQFCSILTKNDYVNSEMYQDFLLYYGTGPGNNYSQAAGSPLAKSLVKILTDEELDNKLWLSFSHDTDLITLYTALGLFPQQMDFSQMQFDRIFKQSTLMPQSGRLIVEQLSCNNEDYVRLNINDAIYPLDCQYGPGFSCKLEDFVDKLKQVTDIDFNSQCGNTDDRPEQLLFYWDYNQVNYNATLEA